MKFHGMSAKQEPLINSYSSYKHPFPHQLLFSPAHGVIKKKKYKIVILLREHEAKSSYSFDSYKVVTLETPCININQTYLRI